IRFCFVSLLPLVQTAAVKISSLQQESPFVSPKTGESLTLQCFYEGDVAARFYWFKQNLGQKPRLISTFYVYEKIGTFYGEFKNNPRFTLDTGNQKNHLTIADLRTSDSATYYCISCYLYTLEISETINVSVQGSGLNIPAQVHQSASESIQPGGSVTLNCTVHTGTCDGEHRVYWFKHSGQAHPGLIYTHGGSNDQCERKPETQTHSCVYNLPMNSLNVSDAGTYYCAVASCGHILFGNGTKLDIEGVVDMVYFWHAAAAFSTILGVLLSVSMCMMNKRNSSYSPEFQLRCPVPSTANAKGYQHTNNLYYAASSTDLTNSSSRQMDPTWSQCVYYSIKQ
uniref:Uncharacterized LOC113125353 n=1 Tax=Mastacembelus armatus TaxID=205130 RepID=A0A3Q3LGW5_9TELE